MPSNLIPELIAKNGGDIEAVIAIIGIPNLLRLAPHLMAIATTATAIMQEQKGK